jgi:hypothetical protein
MLAIASSACWRCTSALEAVVISSKDKRVGLLEELIAPFHDKFHFRASLKLTAIEAAAKCAIETAS